jgi:hypothetical protein
MVSPNLFKKYYCKIKGKNFGPLTLEELKNLAIQGQLQISDKVSLTFPAQEWLYASSIPDLNDIFKFQNYNAVDDAVANNEGYQGGFAQGVNLRLLEKNSIEIVKLLRNIYGWMNFYFYAGMVVAFITILAALANNKGR